MRNLSGDSAKLERVVMQTIVSSGKALLSGWWAMAVTLMWEVLWLANGGLNEVWAPSGNGYTHSFGSGYQL